MSEQYDTKQEALITRTKEKAFMKGVEAARRGKSINNNPYAHVDNQAVWRDGFLSVKPDAR